MVQAVRPALWELSALRLPQITTARKLAPVLATLESQLAILAQFLPPTIVIDILQLAWMHLLTVCMVEGYQDFTCLFGGLTTDRLRLKSNAVMQVFYDLVNGYSADTSSFQQPQRAVNGVQFLQVRHSGVVLTRGALAV